MDTRHSLESTLDEIQQEIFSYCSIKDLLPLRLASRHYLFSVNENDLWKKRTKFEFPLLFQSYSHPDVCNSWKERYIELYQHEYQDLTHTQKKLFRMVKYADYDSLYKYNLIHKLDVSDLNAKDIHHKSLAYWAAYYNNQQILNYLYQLHKKHLFYANGYPRALDTTTLILAIHYYQPIEEILAIRKFIDREIFNEEYILQLQFLAAIETNQTEIVNYFISNNLIHSFDVNYFFNILVLYGKDHLFRHTKYYATYSNLFVNLLKKYNEHPTTQKINFAKSDLLVFAIEMNDLNIINALISTGDFTTVENELTAAIYYKNLAVLKTLLSNFSYTISQNTLNKIFLSAAIDQYDATKYLIEFGADYHYRNYRGISASSYTSNLNIKALLLFFEYLSSKSRDRSDSSLVTFSRLKQLFHIPYSEVFAMSTLFDVIDGNLAITELDKHHDVYNQNSDLQNIIKILSLKNINDTQYLAKSGFILQNLSHLIDFAEHLLIYMGATNIVSRYMKYDTESPVLKISCRYKSKKKCFQYPENDIKNIETFLNDFVTDIMFIYLDLEYGLRKMITPHHTVTYEWSWIHNKIVGHIGLREFLNPREISFDWDKFKLFAENINHAFPHSGMELKIIVKTGIEALPFHVVAKRACEEMLKHFPHTTEFQLSV